MPKHKIAVLSDTHSLLRPEVAEKIKECGLAIHAGDIASKDTMDQIAALGTVYFVRGNVDQGSWAEEIPVSRELELFGQKILVIHNRKQIKEDVSDKDIVIYGHSHKYAEERKAGVCYFNPGSCGPKRFRQEITMAVLTVDSDAGSFSFEKVDCQPQASLATDNTGSMGGMSNPCNLGNPSNMGSSRLKHTRNQNTRGNSSNLGSSPIPEKDMAKLISKVVKQMNAGRTVGEIAQKNGVEERLVNQILQIYTTHQGIDVRGILDRLDIWGK